MNNATRRALIERKKQSGFPGSIIDVFRAYDQGVDLIGQFQQQQAQQMQVANTPQQQQQGLRPAHQAGNTNASMAFPNQPPNASFNTVGMKAPINLKQYDPRGNLVKSYEAVPPGVKDLKMSSQGGTVIETPAQMQNGGEYNMDRALELGYTADETGHWPSVDYTNGMWLKSSQHPTAIKEFLHGYLDGDHYKTHNIVTNPQGYFGENQLQYVPKQEMKSGGVRKYQTGDFVYGDWREVSREVDPLTNDTIITEQRDGSRTLEYNKRGVNWDVGYRRWLAQGNTGSLAEFKARAEAWKRSQARTEYDTQTRTNRLQSEEDRIFSNLFPLPTLGPSPIPTSEYEQYPSDVSSEVLNATANGQGAYGRPGSSGASGNFSGLGNGYPPTSYQSNVGEVLNETPIEDDPSNVGSTSSPFNVQSTYNLDSRQNIFGKTRSVYTDDVNITRDDGTSTNSRTRQVDITRPGQENKTRGRSIFEEFDENGDRIVRQVDKLKKGGRVRKYQTGNALDTLYVNNPNDPRIQQYADSLSAYNFGLESEALIMQDANNLLTTNNNAFNRTGSNRYTLGTTNVPYDSNNQDHAGVSTPHGLYPSRVIDVYPLGPSNFSSQQRTTLPMPNGGNWVNSRYELWDKPKQPVVFRPGFETLNSIRPSQINQSRPTPSLQTGYRSTPMTRPSQTVYKQDPTVSTGQYPIGEDIWNPEKRQWRRDLWDAEMQRDSRELAIPRGYRKGGMRKYFRYA